MFLKNRNVSSKIKRSKVTDYAALSIEANSVDPEQTAPIGSSLIWVHTVCYRGFLNISADEKADDFCFDWRIRA